MTQTPQTPQAVKARLLAAIEPHVPFDGWTEAAFRLAVSESGVDPAVAKGLCPRGAVDLAVAFHEAGDAAMVRRIQTEDLSGLKFRDKVAAAVRFRLEAVTDRELVRRGSTLFALPAYAPDGAKLIWGTADAIWTALGDTSEDINWYTKRASLSAVYSSTVLYWLGDDSPDHARTWGFLDRRIDGVMQFEKFKAKVRGNALLKPFLAGPDWALSWVKAPRRSPPSDLPGTLSEPE
ncbi:MAG: COQ9 family protein [Rhodobacteraceae bacterium]|nr:COQ9 family protein [Paracoccaceae bacterium]